VECKAIPLKDIHSKLLLTYRHKEHNRLKQIQIWGLGRFLLKNCFKSIRTPSFSMVAMIFLMMWIFLLWFSHYELRQYLLFCLLLQIMGIGYLVLVGSTIRYEISSNKHRRALQSEYAKFDEENQILLKDLRYTTTKEFLKHNREFLSL